MPSFWKPKREGMSLLGFSVLKRREIVSALDVILSICNISFQSTMAWVAVWFQGNFAI